MKAAVLNHLGTSPVYQEFQQPVSQNEEQILINIKAASVKNIDKLRASGRHYASYTQLPVVVGIDGVGTLENGQRVYAQGITGMIAEKALISKNRYTILPDDIDDSVAAALPNAVLGAAMALIFKGNLQKGNTVLINGATGVTGQLAVQLARHFGAANIIATGRNEATLEKLAELGAHTTFSLKQGDETIVQQLQSIHKNTPVNIVIDYLWGRPIELIIKALSAGGLNANAHKVRIVTVGDMAGEHISLNSGTLRSSAIEIAGSGFGSLSQEDLKKFGAEILPEMFQLAADGKLTIGTRNEKLENIETAWNDDSEPGKRIVIRM